MPDCIERETLLTHAIALNNPYELGENVVPVSDIEDAPAADVETVRHGKWIDEDTAHNAFCSQCGRLNRVSRRCPNCGAKMQGDST